MKKKLLALLLSGAMILSLTTPVALAEEPEGECCGACGQVECVCPPEEAPCEVCGKIECVCEKIEELPEEEVPGAAAPEIPEEPTACEICGEIECECEKIEEPEVPETPEIPEEPTACEKCGEIECICEGVNDYAELYEALMNCESIEEFDALANELTEEEIDAFYNSLTDAEIEALDELMFALVEESLEVVYPTVDYTEAAPFLDPVVGVAPRARMMFAAPRAAATAETKKDAQGLETSKRVNPAEGGQEGEYVLTLEAWATGTTTLVPGEPIPTDIVLVLDQSGSMAESFATYTYTATSERDPRTLYYYVSYGYELFVKRSDGSYAKVTVTYRNSRYTFTYQDVDGTTKSATNVTNSSSIADWDFHTRSSTNSGTRLNALKAAVKKFAAEVATKAKGTDGVLGTDDDVDHTISVIGFASGTNYSGKNYNYGNTELFVGSKTYTYNAGAWNSESHAEAAQQHYADAPQDMSDSDDVDNVTASIDKLEASGGTLVNLGLEMANGVLNAIKPEGDEERNQVVIVFTDGDPGWSGDFESGTANSAIKQAATIKENGATVYTVGIFTGANATTPVSSSATNANKFMHYVSSNFANAESMNSPGDDTYPETGSYYLSASDSGALSNIFEAISENIVSGGSNIKLDEKAVVKDVITDQFDLPANAATDGIKVYTAEYGKNGFGTPVQITDTEEMVSVSGRSVSVTGFNFAENWVGQDTDKDGNKTNRGKKLIIQIPIEVRDGFLGGNGVYTNGSASGVYDGNETLVENFDRPSVDVQIKDVTVTAPNVNVYLSGSVTDDELIAGLTVKSGDVEFSMDPSKTNYGLKDWQIAYVTIDDGDSGISDYDNLSGDEDYSVTVTITPDSEGEATEKSGTGKGKINVFKPCVTVTATDIWADYNQSVALDTWGLEEGNLEILWQHKDTKGNLTTAADAGLKAEDAPTVVPAEFKFAQVVGDVETACENEYVTNELDADFNVKGLTCTVGGSVSYETKLGETLLVTKAVPAEKHDFTIHINHFTMTITKSVGDSKEIYHQDFIFDVVSSTEEKFQVVIHGNGTKTIKGLVCGKTYDVYENGEWSWRYSAVGNEGKVENVTFNNNPNVSNTNPGTGSKAVAFENKQNIFTWLSGNDFLNNRKKRGEV